MGCSLTDGANSYFGFSVGPWLTWSDSSDTTMTINWVSKLSGEGSIKYGLDKSDLNQEIKEDEKVRKHTVKMTALKADTIYYYQLQGPGLMVDKTVYQFKTAPVVGLTSDYSFIVVGDKQPNTAAEKESNMIISDAVAKEKSAFICQIGDVASAGGDLNSWKNVLETIPAMAAERPFLSAIGNHDYNSGGFEQFAIFFEYDYHTEVADTGKYYTVKYADSVMIFVDNFDKDLDSGSMTETQKAWVAAELETASKDVNVNWIFLFMHHTLLTTGTSSRNTELQKWIIPLASQYQVDGLFFGHDHHYEHWNYQYGKNGYFYKQGDSPAVKPLPIFCTGGGGAHLELDYGLLDTSRHDDKMDWYNSATGNVETKQTSRLPWNPKKYIDHTSDNEGYGQFLNEGKNYYHYPVEESYSGDNEFYGYVYGEQATHYIKINISSDKKCIISVHYPNGEILSGPGGVIPQTWEYQK